MIHGVNHCYAQSKYFLFRFSEDPAGLAAHAYFIAPDFMLGYFWRHSRRLFRRVLLKPLCWRIWSIHRLAAKVTLLQQWEWLGCSRHNGFQLQWAVIVCWKGGGWNLDKFIGVKGGQIPEQENVETRTGNMGTQGTHPTALSVSGSNCCLETEQRASFCYSRPFFHCVSKRKKDFII